MITIYETRSFAEARTFESLTRLIYAATAVFVMLYAGIPLGSTIGIMVFLLFLFFLIVLLISLFVQVYREKLKLATLKINTEKKKIKFINILWSYKFKNVKTFYTPESRNYIDLIIDTKQFRIWESDIEENKELFNEFIEILDETNTRSIVPISKMSYSNVRAKTFMYLLFPYSLLFYLTMIAFPQWLDYLKLEHELFLSFMFFGAIIIVLAARIIFNIKIKQLLKEKAENIKEA